MPQTASTWSRHHHGYPQQTNRNLCRANALGTRSLVRARHRERFPNRAPSSILPASFAMPTAPTNVSNQSSCAKSSRVCTSLPPSCLGKPPLGIIRPEEWYLIGDTLPIRQVKENRIGVPLAPYDYDSNANEHQRLREELSDLLPRDEALTRQIELKHLSWPIPGYTRSGDVSLDKEREQEVAARRIGYYHGAHDRSLRRRREGTHQDADRAGLGRRSAGLPAVAARDQGGRTQGGCTHDAFAGSDDRGSRSVHRGSLRKRQLSFDLAIKHAATLQTNVNL
jgi:hypothetical protein